MELGFGLTKYIEYALYISYIVVIILTLFYRIDVGLIYFTLMLPQQNLRLRLEEYPLGGMFLNLFVLLFILKWLTRKREAGEKIFEKNHFTIPIIIFLVWSYFELIRGAFFLGHDVSSVIFRFDSERFSNWKHFVITYLLFFIVFNNVKSQKQIRYLIMAITVAILSMTRTFIHNFTRPDHFSWDARTFTGAFTYLGSNELAAFYAMYGAVILSLFLREENRWQKILYGVTAVGNYYCVMFLLSRGGYLASLVSITILGLLKERKLLLLLLVLLISWQVVLPTAVKERIEMTWTDDNSYDETTLERISMINIGTEIFARYPILGVGYNVIPYMNLHDDVVGQFRNSLHNGYLLLAVEMGLIGVFLFMCLMVLCIYTGWKLYRERQDGFSRGLGLGVVTCVFAILASNISGDFWQYPSVMGYFWMLVAICMRLLKQDIPTESKNGETKEVIDLRPRKIRKQFAHHFQNM